MTDQEIRIAIAQACGWGDRLKLEQHWDKGTVRYTSSIPDFPNDLNAMHEAEKTLDFDKLQYIYSHNLYNIVVPKKTQPFRATARQRAEAFLKTIGKWKE